MSNVILTQIPAVYVRILYHYQLNPSIVTSTVKFINEIINLFFHVVPFSLKVNQYYPIFHCLWNFWEMFSLISYLKYFSRMKRWWRKALQLPPPVTTKRNLISRYKGKKLFERYRQIRLLPNKIFAKVISCFKSFSLIWNNLRILSSVYLIEIFDLLGKELKFA